MTASDQARLMLAELMGSSAGDPSAPSNRPPYDDVRVCRPYLFGYCHHELLSATVRRTTHFLRAELGECPRIHDAALRADYELAQQGKDHYYDIDAFDSLERFIQDTDRKMETARTKLAETQHELSDDAQEKAEIVLALNEDLGKVLAEAERLGEAGHVQESLKLMGTVETVKQKKAVAEAEYRAAIPSTAIQQQKLRVCADCGAYLGIHDNDRRLADHFGGKLHMGFVDLREKHADLKLTIDERKAKRKTEMGGGADRGGDRGERGSTRGGEREKERDRGSRDVRKRSRSKERSSHKSSRSERSTKRSRSRDRDRSKRSKRSRSRSRDKDRDRSSRHKSSRSKRSRSRDRGERKSHRDRSRSRDRSKREKSADKVVVEEKEKVEEMAVEKVPEPVVEAVAPPVRVKDLPQVTRYLRPGEATGPLALKGPTAHTLPSGGMVAVQTKMSSIELYQKRLIETAEEKQRQQEVGHVESIAAFGSYPGVSK